MAVVEDFVHYLYLECLVDLEVVTLRKTLMTWEGAEEGHVGAGTFVAVHVVVVVVLVVAAVVEAARTELVSVVQPFLPVDWEMALAVGEIAA